ncbi:MAG TPA: sulfatase-like hydrolase/transferase [Thermoanaerobaculia bacterium]|nr:sulfatase-like hydrolase/transferase [Thermoanaerobaculia bacterium]
MARLKVILLALPLLFGCSGAERPAVEPGGPVILISIDTLRADRLPAYGYADVETPAIDALRRDAILYRNAWSHCPMTLPSHVSVLTGLLPTEHGVRNNLGYVFDGSKHVSLPKLLKGSGYATGGAISSYVLRADTGIGKEFDSYDDAIAARANASIGQLEREGGETVAMAEQWIGAHAQEPFFYFLHLFEPHAPYAPPEPFRTRYAGNPYDGEIAAADAIVGRFLDSLKRSGIYDRATIVLLSDHGEGLGDHGEGEHGVFLYREALHVPLIVKLPRSERGGDTVEGNVQLIDVYPTVASLAGAEIPAGVRGRSLLAEADPARGVYSETLLPRLHFGWSDLQSLVSGNHHFIQAPRPELYDLQSDPRETKNVLSDNRRQYAAMRQELERFASAAQAPAAVSKEEAEKLAALGYIGSMRDETGDLPDPKDHIGEMEQLRVAARAEQEGRPGEAMKIYRTILDANPRFTDAWIRLASLHEHAGEPEQAEQAYKQAIQSAPSLAAGLALSVGELQLRMRKLDDSAAHARLAATKPTAAAGAHMLLARIALAKGNIAELETEARLASVDATRRREAAVIVAQGYVAQGRLDEALRLLEGVRSQPGGGPVIDLEATRADALARMNRPADAEAAFRAELERFPSNREAYTKLAILQVTLDRAGDAEQTLDRMFAANRSRSTALLAVETWQVVENGPAAARWRQRAAEIR